MLLLRCKQSWGRQQAFHFRQALAALVACLVLIGLGWTAWSQTTEAPPDIQQLQRDLTELGFDPGPVDGVFGPKTKSALAALQHSRGLAGSGDWDDVTAAALSTTLRAAPVVADQMPSVQSIRAKEQIAPPQPQQTATKSATAAEPSVSALSLTSFMETHESLALPYGILAVSGLAVFLGLWMWRTRVGRKREDATRRRATPEPRLAMHSESDPEKLNDEPESDTNGAWDVDLEATLSQTEIPVPTVASPPEQPNDVVKSRGFVSRMTAVSPAPPNRLTMPTTARWIPAGEAVTVQGRSIPGGLLYFGRDMPTQDGRNTEKCLLNPELPIAMSQPDGSGQHMPYWPSYTTIPPASRLAYLNWLQQGRKDPDAYIGYVFLYFYGLERRLLLGRPEDNEIQEIFEEIKRLRGIYAVNGSFNRYSSALLDCKPLLTGEECQPFASLDLGRVSSWEIPLEIKLGIARRIEAEENLTADWLLSWWFTHPETRLRMPARRAFPEFSRLFALRFMQDHPRGLAIKPPKTRLQHLYRSASGTFEREFRNEIGDLPDIGKVSRPLKIAGAIAERCMDELNAYSRFLGRSPDSRGSIEAHLLLPALLQDHMASDELEALRRWATSKIETDAGVIPAKDLIAKLEGRPPEKITRKALMSASEALARISVGFAPDPRYAHRPPKIDENVILFSLPVGITRLAEPSEAYRAGLSMLSLGCLVAYADGDIGAAEQRRLEALAKGLGALLSAELQRRLAANLRWLLEAPPKFTDLRKRLTDLGADAKKTVAQLAVAIAGADGVIAPAEVRMIQRLYKALGLDEAEIYGDLHAVTVKASSSGPVTVRPAGEEAPGFAIPPPPGPEAQTPSTTPIALDHRRIETTLLDTARVAHLLSDVFGDDESLEIESEMATADEPPTTEIDGLDRNHRPLVLELVTRPSWTQEEFALLADHFGLMEEGALETINEWAFESFGEALLEAYEDLDVNTDIMAQLTQLQEEPSYATA